MIQSEILACESVQHVGGTLNFVTTPDGTPELDERGFFTWVVASSQAEKDKTDVLKHAD